MLPDYLRAVCFDIGGVLVRLPRGVLAEELADIFAVDAGLVRGLLIEHGKRRPAGAETLAAAVAVGCGIPAEASRIAAILRLRQRDIAEPALYPDAVDAIARLRARGWRVCFLSNAISVDTSASPPAYFSLAEAVIHSWEIGYCKPEIGAFRAVEQRMGLAAREIVSVGDSLRSDVLGAIAAGWSAVHLCRDGERSPQQSMPAAPVITSLAELPGLLPVLPRLAEARESRRP